MTIISLFIATCQILPKIFKEATNKFNQYKTIKLTLLRMKHFLIPVNEINTLKSKTLSETNKPSVKGNHSLKTYKK